MLTANSVKDLMKQLDFDVSPPAFVWNPYLTFTNVTFYWCTMQLGGPRVGWWCTPQVGGAQCRSVVHNVVPRSVAQCRSHKPRHADRQTDRKQGI